MICGHSGGDWELGARAIRPDENVVLEFSGGGANSDPVDFAVKELGADRSVWGAWTITFLFNRVVESFRC